MSAVSETMSSKIEGFENFKFEFIEKRILIRLGYKASTRNINPSLLKTIGEEREKLNFLLHPKALYTILDYDETNHHPIFKNAEKVALCICTIGPMLERESTNLIGKSEILRGLILDAFGSEAVEEVVRQTDRWLAEKARSMGFWPSKRFSPGYGKWDIREQEFVFKTLPARDVGVRLTESFMMVPRKSVSFRINFYTDQRLTNRKMSF